MSNSAVLRGKVSRCKSATEFPRKCGRCVKIERQNFLGKIVAATDFPRKFRRATKFPSDRISCDTGRHADATGVETGSGSSARAFSYKGIACKLSVNLADFVIRYEVHIFEFGSVRSKSDFVNPFLYSA